MKVKVNDQFSFELEATADGAEVNGRKIDFDRKVLSGNHTHFIYNHLSYSAEIISEDKTEKSCQVKINGNIYDIKLEDKYDQLLKQLGMDSGQSHKIKEVKAPMPGLVLNVLVEAGAAINKGDSLLILEAMKMENIIKSPVSGIIRAIKAAKGDKVEKNEVLIEFD